MQDGVIAAPSVSVCVCNTARQDMKTCFVYQTCIQAALPWEVQTQSDGYRYKWITWRVCPFDHMLPQLYIQAVFMFGPSSVCAAVSLV